MPSIRRRARRRRDDFEELTAEQRRHLLRGSTFFHGGFTDPDDFRVAWDLHRDELLPQFIAEHPGRRPFGWWFCDHGRERPIADPKATPADIARHRQHERPEHFKFLHTEICRGNPLIYFQQTEQDYLREHGLLSKAEMKSLDLTESE